MGKNFILWNDYYKKNFRELYEKALNFRDEDGNINFPEDINQYDFFKKLFTTVIELLKLYLNNNGIFQFEKYEVIREAFYIELLEDGDIWMTALNLYTVSAQRKREEFNNLFATWLSTNFNIFDHIDDKFSQMVSENE